MDVIIFDENGVPQKSTIDRMQSIRSIGQFEELIAKARRILSIGSEQEDGGGDEFVNMRIKTDKFEIFLVKDEGLFFAVTQNAIGMSNRSRFCMSSSLFLFQFADLHGSAVKHPNRS